MKTAMNWVSEGSQFLEKRGVPILTQLLLLFLLDVLSAQLLMESQANLGEKMMLLIIQQSVALFFMSSVVDKLLENKEPAHYLAYYFVFLSCAIPLKLPAYFCCLLA